MTRLLLARHGLTDWNTQNRLQGHADRPLNELGQRQAAALGKRLAGIRVDRIVASDLLRARQTAGILAACLDAQSPEREIELEAGLREISFGDWEGLTFSEIEAQDPTGAAAWQADFLHFSPPKGETVSQLAARVEPVFTQMSPPDSQATVLVVAHGGPLQVLICLALGLSPNKFWQFHLSPTSLTEINTYPQGAILNLLNDTCHLDLLHLED